MAKFWNCRRVPGVTEEVIQSIGGNAYIEEHPCPRYYREAPLNAIWEGTSNMMVMDVGRVLPASPGLRAGDRRDPPGRGRAPAARQALDEIEELVLASEDTTRYLVTRIALAIQAALPGPARANRRRRRLHRFPVGIGRGPGYGTLRGMDFPAIIDFARLGCTVVDIGRQPQAMPEAARGL